MSADDPVPIRLKTPLAQDLEFGAMELTEELGRLFTCELELLSLKEDLKLDDVLGKDMQVEIDLPTGDTRFVHGYVSEMGQTGWRGGRAVYRAVLRPWFWFLTQRADCRIFQDLTVPDIIKQVFRDHGFSDFKESLSATYRKWEYCVQYRETDFNFVSRLMEQEGIYYYCEHEDGKDVLVLSDSYGSHNSIPDYKKIDFLPPSENVIRDDHVFDWTMNKSVRSGAYTLSAFHFKKPKANLEVNASIVREHAMADYEIYDYPGEYFETKEGERYASVRIEELQSQYERVRAHTNVKSVYAGGLFELEGHPRKDQNREWLIVAAHHSYTRGSSGGPILEGLKYSGSFEAMDSQGAFRSARITPKPVVQGPQTAFVVGPKGEEIHTDEFGRVKVLFRWDREGLERGGDEKSSCWVRVAQVWAGAQWGGITTPRVGQEVIVSFVEGDPDRPIITGRVYNGDNKPPYQLPKNSTISTLKSNSSKGGGGFNELRFEDKKGEEQVYIHAEKNFDMRVKNDRFETILHDRHLVVENDKREHIKNSRHETVDSHHHEKIVGDRNLKVEGKEAKAVTKTLSLTVDDDVIEVFKKNHSEQVADDYYLKGKNVVIEGTTNVTIKVGQSYIAIEAGGIEIGTTGKIMLDAKGNVSINGIGGIKVESPAQVQVKGSMTKVEGSGIAELKGGLVKIN